MKFLATKKIRIIAGVIVFTFLFLLLPLFQANSKSIEELESEISRLQEKAKILGDQISVFRQNVKEKRKEISTLQEQINQIEAEIARLNAEVRQSENQILLTSLEINRLGLQISQTQEKIKKNKELLEELLRTLNEFDNKNLAALLIESSSLSEFFNQQNFISQLNLQTKDTLTRTKLLKESLTEEKNRQEKKHSVLEQTKRELQVKKLALNRQENQKSEILRKTRGEEQQYQNLLSSVERQKAEFLQEIQELETEVLIQKNYLQRVEAGKIPPKGTKLFIWPENKTVLTQSYGNTSFARRGAYGGAPHNGIDMSAGAGTPIMAAADGTVLAKGFNNGWGNWVALEHAGGIVTLYSHMLQPSAVAVGSQVNTRDTIGYEGATGFVTGSHLHFSVYVKFFTFERDDNIFFNYFEGTINPLDYL